MNAGQAAVQTDMEENPRRVFDSAGIFVKAASRKP